MCLIQKKILLVEDNLRLQTLLINEINREYECFSIDPVENEYKAIENLKNIEINYTEEQSKYSFAIVDIRLNDGGGSIFGGLKVIEYIVENSIETNIIVATVMPNSYYQLPSGKEVSVKQYAKNLGVIAVLDRLDIDNYYDKVLEYLSF